MKSHALSKKITIFAAVIALTAILGVCLAACNSKANFEKRLKDKDYAVVAMTAEQIAGVTDKTVGEVEWAIIGMKGDVAFYNFEIAGIIKCKRESDAKECKNGIKFGGEGYSVARKGKIIIFGTEQGVKDAQ